MGFKSPFGPSVKFGHFGVLECHKDAEDFLLFLDHFAHVPLIHPQRSASIAVLSLSLTLVFLEESE